MVKRRTLFSPAIISLLKKDIMYFLLLFSIFIISTYIIELIIYIIVLIRNSKSDQPQANLHLVAKEESNS